MIIIIDRVQQIQNYIDGYNEFDINKMVADFDENIVFENRQNGDTLTMKGLAAFKDQAEQAKAYFSERKQTVQSLKHFEQESEVAIAYFAVLAMDFPNGLKKGQALNLEGKSVFVFDQGRIVKLTDIS